MIISLIQHCAIVANHQNNLKQAIYEQHILNKEPDLQNFLFSFG